MFEAGLQRQVLLHQSFVILHKRLQEKDLLVKRRTRGLRPTEREEANYTHESAQGLPPRLEGRTNNKTLLQMLGGFPRGRRQNYSHDPMATPKVHMQPSEAQPPEPPAEKGLEQ